MNLKESIDKLSSSSPSNIDEFKISLLELIQNVIELINTKQSNISIIDDISLTDCIDSDILTENLNQMDLNGSSDSIHQFHDDKNILGLLQEMKGDNVKIMQDLAALKTHDHQSHFKIHEIPLLFVREEVKFLDKIKEGILRKSIPPLTQLTQKMKKIAFKSYEIKFLCNVCGKPSTKGYTNDITREWLVKVSYGLEYTLFALEIAGKIGGYSVPQLSWIVRELREKGTPPPLLSSDTLEKLNKWVEGREIIENIPLAEIDPSIKSILTEISSEHAKMVKSLFIYLEDPEADKCGLHFVNHSDTGHSAWVCSKECKNEFLTKGHECLLLKMKFS